MDDVLYAIVFFIGVAEFNIFSKKTQIITVLGHSIPIVSIPRSRKYRSFFGIEISELIRLNIDIFDISEICLFQTNFAFF
jgi:hypothetical protein